MSEANKQFHMAIAYAGKNPYLASFYERLLNQGQRMLHLHFEYLERTHEGYLLTDEHQLMLDAIKTKNVDLADELAHAPVPGQFHQLHAGKLYDRRHARPAARSAMTRISAMKVGFVGTGAITEAMVTGMLSGSPLANEIIISPRNADVAAKLAEKFPAAR